MAILRVPDTFSSIQNAVNAASAGDSIRVSAGYAGNESVGVSVDDLVIGAPASVTGIVLFLATNITKVSLAGDSAIQVVGNTQNIQFLGNDGANFFSPGSGTDTLNGGAGDDTFLINGGGGTARGRSGSDTVESNDLGGYDFTGMETLDVGAGGYVYGSVAQLVSFPTITDSVNPAASPITLRLSGAGGTLNLLSMIAGTHSAEVFNNNLTGGITVVGTAQGDTLGGSSFDDNLSGGDGSDLILGSGGTDVLSGGAGDDTFRIEYGGSGSISGGDGTDTVESNDLGTFSLAGVETLDTFGFNQIYVTLAQLSSFETITDSLAAADSQISLFLRGAGGVINLLSRVAGAHSVHVSDAGLTGPVTVNGTDNADFMIASSNLTGLRGKGGDDTFQIDYAGATTGTVDGGEGTDTVESNDLGNFSFSHVEVLDTHGFEQVYATAAQLSSFGTITDGGGAADSQITFYLRGAGGMVNLQPRVAGAHSAFVADSNLTGAVTVSGTDNADFLIASTHINVLRGNGGDDTFQVDYAAGGVVGSINGGAGTDTVQSNDLGNFSLSNVEILDTHGFNQVYATAAQLSAFGTITDSDADPASQITVILRDGPGAVDFSTRVGGAHSVQVYASGLSAGVKITGSANSDAITGSSFADILSGGGGNDTLTGGAGGDTFVFDQPLVAGNVATIVDFTPGSDSIALSRSIFTAAGRAGALNPNAFFAGTAAHDTDDRIIYNALNGQLMYDADGTGPQGAQTVAVLSTGLAVTAADFKLV